MIFRWETAMGLKHISSWTAAAEASMVEADTTIAIVPAAVLVAVEAEALPDLQRRKASLPMVSGIVTARLASLPSTSKWRRKARTKVVGSIHVKTNSRNDVDSFYGTRMQSFVKRELCWTTAGLSRRSNTYPLLRMVGMQAEVEVACSLESIIYQRTLTASHQKKTMSLQMMKVPRRLVLHSTTTAKLPNARPAPPIWMATTRVKMTTCCLGHFPD
jgi:hypothetical protein